MTILWIRISDVISSTLATFRQSGQNGFYFLVLTLIIVSCLNQQSVENHKLKIEIDSLNIVYGKDLTYDTLKLAGIDSLMKVCDSIHYPDGEINLAITSSRIYMSNNKNTDALAMLNLAQQRLKETDNPLLEASVNFYLGKFNFRINNSDAALDYFLKSSQISLEAADSAMYVKTLINIGNLYLERGNLSKAKEYFNKSLSINRKRNNFDDLSIDYHHLSVYYLRKSELDSAKYYLDKELEMNKESNNTMLYIYNLNNLASFQIENGEYDAGERNSLEALRLLDSISPFSPPTYSRSVVHANLGVLNQKKGNLDMALHHFNIANQDTAFKFVPEFRIKLLFDLYKIHKEMGNHDSSHAILEQYLLLRDINEKAVADQNLLAMEMRYNFRQLQQEHEHKQRRMRLLFYGSLVILGMGLFTLIIFIQKQRIKIKNEQLSKNIQEIKLERLNRELASQALNMVRMNERKISLIKTIKERMPSFKRDNQMVMAGIIEEFEKDKNELVWQEFEMRFTEVHSEFYKKLSKINPNLTINEKRLCAFLLLDMTTKEISTITGQSVRALEQARTRLRKQLNLTNSNASITAFLNSL